MRLRWLFVPLLLLPYSHAWSATLGVASNEPAPTVAALIAGRLPAELALEVRPFEDADSLQQALVAGELDFALLEEPASRMAGISAVAELYPSVLHLLVRAGEPPGDLGAALTQGGLWAGGPGAASQTLAARLAADYGAGAPGFLDDPWTVDPDAYFIFGGLLSVDALSRLQDFELVSLGGARSTPGGSVADGIALRHPHLRTLLLPAELYPGLSREPVMTLAVQTLLVAREDIDDETVYNLAMAVERLRPEIAAAYPLAGLEQPPRSTLAARALPLHPGAQRFVDRELPSFVERYAEFLGAALTTGVALISLGVALYRRRRQARKDRLDSYYQQALECRAALENGSVGRERVAEQLRGLQSEVFELLIAERIDADSALVVFLSLSNQLLRECAALPGREQVVDRLPVS